MTGYETGCTEWAERPRMPAPAGNCRRDSGCRMQLRFPVPHCHEHGFAGSAFTFTRDVILNDMAVLRQDEA